jgi:hypothetical protein
LSPAKENFCMCSVGVLCFSIPPIHSLRLIFLLAASGNRAFLVNSNKWYQSHLMAPWRAAKEMMQEVARPETAAWSFSA